MSASVAAAPYISVRDVSKRYRGPSGDFLALREISLDVARGDFTSIIGPSGCGKSTLLQIIAGLIPSSGGEVLLGGKRVEAPPHEVVYVFQQYTKSIFPWLTVRQNVAFGLENRDRLTRRALAERCDDYMKLVGLTSFADYYPWQLSGGMQQRVAIARALVCRPGVLLMDEPFSSVDALTRAGLQDLVLRIWQDLGITIVFVTHDIEEAVYLSNRVVVLSSVPATIVEEVAIELPRPRSQIDTKESPAYLQYRHRLLERIVTEESAG